MAAPGSVEEGLANFVNQAAQDDADPVLVDLLIPLIRPSTPMTVDQIIAGFRRDGTIFKEKGKEMIAAMELVVPMGAGVRKAIRARLKMINKLSSADVPLAAPASQTFTGSFKEGAFQNLPSGLFLVELTGVNDASRQAFSTLLNLPAVQGEKYVLIGSASGPHLIGRLAEKAATMTLDFLPLSGYDTDVKKSITSDLKAHFGREVLLAPVTRNPKTEEPLAVDMQPQANGTTRVVFSPDLDSAMAKADDAETAPRALTNGGIDIQNIDVARTGTGDAIRFDEAALQELVSKGFDGLTPVFLGITPWDNPLTAMGVK